MAAAKPLMSAQRYPYDFDGIAAGAPANNMDVQNTHHHANRLLTNQAVPGYIPLPQRNTYVLLQGNLPYIHAKVVAACDGLDGVLDGVIDDPRNCKFDTNTLVCANNATNRAASARRRPTPCSASTTAQRRSTAFGSRPNSLLARLTAGAVHGGRHGNRLRHREEVLTTQGVGTLREPARAHAGRFVSSMLSFAFRLR